MAKRINSLLSNVYDELKFEMDNVCGYSLFIQSGVTTFVVFLYGIYHTKAYKLINFACLKYKFMPRTTDIQELSNFLLDFATTLMGAGSHTSRVVRNVSRIADSFGYGVDMTVFQRNVTMTIKHRDDYSIRRTYVRGIPSLPLDFRIISDLSSLSWEAYDSHLELSDMQKRYQAIIIKPRLSRWLVLFLVSFANAAFCRLFGGDFMAMGLVWIATLVGFFVRQELMKRHMNHMAVFVICSFVASLIAGLGFRFNLGTTEDIALGTSVLFLIPGVPLINSILDILEGHVLVGWSRVINAFILIICIALGLSITLLILGKEVI